MIVRIPTRLPTICATLAAASVLACSSAVNRTRPMSSDLPAGEGSDPIAVSRAKADSTRYPWTAADARFMAAMIGHHRQAVEMAGKAPSHGANASVRILAERIINAQQDEIATAQLWLRDRLQPLPGAGAGRTMTMDGAEHEMLMPGMISESRMRQLDRADGRGFDRLFLTLMIEHHRGAVAMVKELFASRGAGQDQAIFKFASDVEVDQITEIARMERMLGALIPDNRDH